MMHIDSWEMSALNILAQAPGEKVVTDEFQSVTKEMSPKAKKIAAAIRSIKKRGFSRNKQPQPAMRVAEELVRRSEFGLRRQKAS